MFDKGKHAQLTSWPPQEKYPSKNVNLLSQYRTAWFQYYLPTARMVGHLHYVNASEVLWKPARCSDMAMSELQMKSNNLCFTEQQQVDCSYYHMEEQQVCCTELTEVSYKTELVPHMVVVVRYCYI